MEPSAEPFARARRKPDTPQNLENLEPCRHLGGTLLEPSRNLGRTFSGTFWQPNTDLPRRLGEPWWNLGKTWSVMVVLFGWPSTWTATVTWPKIIWTFGHVKQCTWLYLQLKAGLQKSAQSGTRNVRATGISSLRKKLPPAPARYVILELRTITSRLRLPSTGLTVPLCKRPRVLDPMGCEETQLSDLLRSLWIQCEV